MAQKTKNVQSKQITLTQREGTFSTIFHRTKEEAVSEEVIQFKTLLSNERAKLIHTIKTKNPESIYQLAKLLGRDFKAVRQDIRLLEKFGIVELISSQKNGRERIRPVIEVDQLEITLIL